MKQQLLPALYASTLSHVFVILTQSQLLAIVGYILCSIHARTSQLTVITLLGLTSVSNIQKVVYTLLPKGHA
jgi:hypothetical protein